MELKPTPEPWSLYQLADDERSYGKNAGKFIITAQNGNVEVCGVIQNDADAPILAAALDMRETLKAIASDEDACSCNTRSWYGKGHDSACAITLAQNAIATRNTPAKPKQEDDGRVHTGQTYNVVLDAAEVDTVLAALRYFQADLDEITKNPGIHFDANDPLTHSQIDALCEYINLEA